MFLFKNNVKYVFSFYVLLNKFCLFSGTVNVRWNCFNMNLENDLSHCLQMWQHKFSQAEEATSKILPPRICAYKGLILICHSSKCYGRFLFLVKLQAWQRCFPGNFLKFFKTAIIQNSDWKTWKQNMDKVLVAKSKNCRVYENLPLALKNMSSLIG